MQSFQAKQKHFHLQAVISSRISKLLVWDRLAARPTTERAITTWRVQHTLFSPETKFLITYLIKFFHS